jgi:hypothetical protein
LELYKKGLITMASSGKKKTTMAKLTRESKLRERRLDKAAKKDARKRGVPVYTPDAPDDELSAITSEPGVGVATAEPAAQPPADTAMARHHV